MSDWITIAGTCALAVAGTVTLTIRLLMTRRTVETVLRTLAPRMDQLDVEVRDPRGLHVRIKGSNHASPEDDI